MVGQKDASLKKSAAKLLGKFIEKKRMQMLTQSFNKCHRQTMKTLLKVQNDAEKNKVK